ncbi:hypothetical protein TNCV_4950111 [Trichonephila clavipes]|nr:hypothetical protein TNCV_4950111 [Trichonephila clavipes]
MLTAVPLRLGSNPGEDMDVCKCIVPSRHGVTLNNRRVASTLVRLVEGEESVCLALTLTGEDVCRHSIDCCFDSGVIWDTHVSSSVKIRINMSTPSSS